MRDIRRVLAYRRVSPSTFGSAEHGDIGTSLEGQHEEITRYCAAYDLPAPMDFVEVESAGAEYEEKRVEVARLLKAVRPGDLVAVAKLDRFSRDILFTIANVREIIKKGGKFLSLAERFDAATPEGETQMAMWAAIAQMERARIKERTGAQRRRLRAQGKFIDGKPPYGYLRAKGKDPSDKPRRLEIDPKLAPAVREMFELCIQGRSAVAISKYLQSKYPGSVPFGRPWVLPALKNRVYAGQLAMTPVRPAHRRGPGYLPAEWRDTHEPIISLETWYAAQSALRGRRCSGPKARSDSRTFNWLIRGLARCTLCGTMCASVPRSSTTPQRHPGYYVCRQRLTPNKDGGRCVTSPYLRQPDADAVVERATVGHLKSLRSSLLRPPPPQRSGASFSERRAKNKAARERVVTLVSQGLMNVSDVAGEVERLDQELTEIEAAEAEYAAEATDDTVASRRGALAFVERVASMWEGFPVSKRRAVIAALTHRIAIGPEGGPTLIWCDAPTIAASFARGTLPDLDASDLDVPARRKTRATVRR